MTDKSRSESPAPRIWISCLAAYNSGTLHGRWIDAARGADAIRDQIQEVLRTSPEPFAEEWAIHDYEGFGPIRIHEYEDIEHVAELAEFVQEHGDLGAELVMYCGGLEYAREMMEERYAGSYNSLDEFAGQLLEDQGSLQELPENLRPYFDYNAYARDLELNGDIDSFRVGGQVHVFWRR